MANALTVPHAVAALILCVAAAAKLRSPGGAARAIGRGPGAVRAFAVAELALGVWALASATLVAGLLMAALYSAFAVLTLRLARVGESCGCFGARSEPASPLQSVLSAVLAGVAAVAAVAGTRSGAWVLGQPPAAAMLLVIGTVGVAYGVVLAYSELALMWKSWSPA